jgi:hypothetical protein
MYVGGRGRRLLDYAFVDNTLFALSGLMARSPFSARLADAGPEATALIDFIMSNGCPVSVLLTEAEKARLLQIKRDVIEAGQRLSH